MEKYTKRNILRDLGKAYKDLNNAYLKFMRPWNKARNCPEINDIMFIINLQIMKEGIEGVMNCWANAIKYISEEEKKTRKQP